MGINSKLQCEYKQLLIDSFEINGISVKVYIADNKKSVKQYCKDTGMNFKEGFKIFYEKPKPG